MEKIRWGILSTAKIGLKQVIPGIQAGDFGEVTAIASRSLEKAEVAASSLGIDDQASRYLATRVYQHWLDGATLPQALRQGQLDLPNGNSHWAHPFYWAFFRIYQ